MNSLERWPCYVHKGKSKLQNTANNNIPFSYNEQKPTENSYIHLPYTNSETHAQKPTHSPSAGLGFKPKWVAPRVVLLNIVATSHM